MNKNNAYNYGRLIAIVECAIDNTKVTFPADCITRPLLEFVPKLRQISSKHGEHERVIAEIMEEIDSDWAFPNSLTDDEQQRAWVGYYKQKASDHRIQMGQLIANRRLERGMTLEELSEKAGIHYSNLNKIEHGKYNVSLDILNRVVDVLGGVIGIQDK